MLAASIPAGGALTWHSSVKSRPFAACCVQSDSRPQLALILWAPLVASACASLQPAPPGWVREVYTERRWSCSRGACQTVVQTRRGSFVVWTRAREYDPHEIPGWDNESKAERRASSVLKWVFRRAGGTTDRVRVGVGTRVVTDTSDGGWTLTCAAFWIDDEEIEKGGDGDHIARSTRRTRGLDCRAAASRDTSVIRWRFRRGVAPPLDSLASVYDSLAARNSPTVSTAPPMSLERLATDGRAGARYEVAWESPGAIPRPTLAERVGLVMGLRVSRESGSPPIATLHQTMAPDYGRGTLDFGPDVSEEEARILRLLAVALHMPLTPTH
jgi:hypothetical protein